MEENCKKEPLKLKFKDIENAEDFQKHCCMWKNCPFFNANCYDVNEFELMFAAYKKNNPDYELVEGELPDEVVKAAITDIRNELEEVKKRMGI